MVHLYGIDPTDVIDLTKAEITGRKVNMDALEVMRKRVPGFKNAKLKNAAFSLGTRESRKITAEYFVTGEDVKSEARFKDSIRVCPEFLDGHGYLYMPTTGRYFHVRMGRWFC